MPGGVSPTAPATPGAMPDPSAVTVPAPTSAPVTNAPGTNTPAVAPSAAVPVSPAIPPAAPGLPALPPAPNPAQPGAGQTFPAAPPASLSPVTLGVAPLVLTADGAVTRIVRQNLGVLAALKDVFAARSGVRSAAALSPPVFTIGPAFQAGGTTDGLLFEQPLELNGTRGARTDVARAQLRLTQAQAIAQLQSLVHTARTSVYILARTQERLRLAHAASLLAEQFDEIARRQVELGARPGIERRQTAVAAARARIVEAQAAGEELAARAALNAYLGRAPLDPVDASLGPEGGAAGSPPDIAAAQRQALRSRAEIAIAEATRDIPAARARLGRAQGRPDIAPEFRVSQISPTYMDAGLGVIITVPIDYGTRRNQVRLDEQTADADQGRVTGAQALVRLDASQAAVRLGAAQDALREYDGGLLENARAVLDAALFGFREGATTVIALLDAQRTYQAVAAEGLDARAQAAQARADFDRAIGAVPPALLAELEKDITQK